MYICQSQATRRPFAVQGFPIAGDQNSIPLHNSILCIYGQPSCTSWFGFESEVLYEGTPSNIQQQSFDDIEGKSGWNGK